MIEGSNTEKSMELLTENLIKMLGKSNEKTMELSKRVSQLEFIVLQSIYLTTPRKKKYTLIRTSTGKTPKRYAIKH